MPGVPSILGNEDCLFLNVYAPSNASRLPVLVYIHGGGYGFGDGTLDMSGIVNSNDNNFIAVTIQYRVKGHSHSTHLPLVVRMLTEKTS